MEDNIFDVEFESGGKKYTGWVNPADKIGSNGLPNSFHVVLNDVSFGHLSFNNATWTVNEERPAELVQQVGAAIEKWLIATSKNQE